MLDVIKKRIDALTVKRDSAPDCPSAHEFQVVINELQSLYDEIEKREGGLHMQELGDAFYNNVSTDIVVRLSKKTDDMTDVVHFGKVYNGKFPIDLKDFEREAEKDFAKTVELIFAAYRPEKVLTQPLKIPLAVLGPTHRVLYIFYPVIPAFDAFITPDDLKDCLFDADGGSLPKASLLIEIQKNKE